MALVESSKGLTWLPGTPDTSYTCTSADSDMGYTCHASNSSRSSESFQTTTHRSLIVSRIVTGKILLHAKIPHRGCVVIQAMMSSTVSAELARRSRAPTKLTQKIRTHLVRILKHPITVVYCLSRGLACGMFWTPWTKIPGYALKYHMWLPTFHLLPFKK